MMLVDVCLRVYVCLRVHVCVCVCVSVLEFVRQEAVG